MLDLLLAIIFNSVLGIIFKLFAIYRVNNLSAIVVNYFVCFAVGIIVTNGALLSTQPAGQDWFKASVFIGVLFIIGFNVIASTVKYFGVGVTTIMQKMSLIFVVVYAVSFLGEEMTIIKAAGLFSAILSVVMLNWPESGPRAKAIGSLIFLPLGTLAISGCIDVTFLHISRKGIATGKDIHFIAYLFLFAGMVGLMVLIFQLMRNKVQFHIRDLLWGIILGLPNFFSIYFVLRMLDTGWDGSVIFPINNIGILVFSVVAGIVLFKERLNRLKFIGFILSIIAIAIMAYTQLR